MHIKYHTSRASCIIIYKLEICKQIEIPSMSHLLISLVSTCPIQSAVVLDVLNNALQESNLNGYSSLQETGVGSQASLNTAEMYGLFLAQAITEKDKGEFVHTKQNLGKPLLHCHIPCQLLLLCFSQCSIPRHYQILRILL